MNIQNTYLAKLYRADKGLFAVVLVLILGTLYGVRYSREEFPFLLYGMYSLKEEPQQSYTTYRFVVDSMELPYTDFLDPKKELIAEPLKSGAIQYQEGKFTESKMVELTDWLYRLYYTPWESDKHYRQEIYKLNCVYNSTGRPYVVKKELVYSHARD